MTIHTPMSKRITTLTGGGSDGWDVFIKARKMIAAGTPVTELTIGEHDIRTAAPILQDMHRAAMDGHTGYAMVPGTDALRDTVARRTQERTGVPTTRDNVLITPGGQSALFAAHAATCDPGDTALYLDPYYATYPGTLRGVSAIPHAIKTRAEDAFQPRASDIDTAARAVKNAKSLLINSPNNPTGTVYSQSTMEGIAQACQSHGLWLISDEVYDTQIWEGTHISPRALPDMAGRTLVVGSMSKSHAMTGSRCGWLIAPPEVIDHLITFATHTTYGVPGFIQDASAYALSQGSAFEAEIAAPFKRRRALARNVLAQQNTVGLIPAQGAMYLMLDIRATGLSGDAFANALLDTHHIAVMPGESFGESAAGHVRVAMTIEDEAFETALKTLCHFAETRA
ncbi:pyridoxal phosphate-dependent aminotransferase [uncultured Tateyamaria sp.]|uniref:pyridoxal phosphate-dependent aminotransferase n=1 Tax=uncultured Tateyamaria sp. TaxID=455651 RepID=UPI00260359D2|nr:pyridoxal phosphate-dependent aminotransferase [uncultured Tateyamaria sp.]